ncbi:MAG: GntR family transcriptional regulator [Paracoccaceae bacterium]|nr:MAG: GntR family transcriptional regulator [Alphaproteobacteria bacterium]GIX14879.1 MAG: GntR family transcriptional regulator [Paracoccaceae bacterium]
MATPPGDGRGQPAARPRPGAGRAQDPASGSAGDAYGLIMRSIEDGALRPGMRLVESELAERFGVSRTPIREALQRLETQGVVTREGRSLFVAILDHDQLGELYVVRSELEGLAAALAARHAAPEEVSILRQMLEEDRALIGDPQALSRANKRFHRQIHLASHNRYLVRQLAAILQTMALTATTSLAAEGRGEQALAEHAAILEAIAGHRPEEADAAMRRHLSRAYETRLRLDAAAMR